jgi:hypothetical protein
MSAIGQLLDTVETKVRELLTDFVLKNKEQDGRLDKIEERLDALETPPPSAAKKTTSTRAGAASTSAKADSAK